MFQKRALVFLFAALMTIPVAIGAQTEPNRDPEKAKLVTSDIDLFWKAYEMATPANDLVVYRDEYLEKGSAGLKSFNKLRIGSSCSLVDAINSAPKYYAGLKESSLKVSSYTPQIRASFRKMRELYPEAVFPDVYFVVGRMSSAGTLTNEALLIGVDMFGKTSDASLSELSPWHKAVVGSMERLPFVVAHELIHYQQKYPRNQNSTLLVRAIGEGSADFIASLISGSHVNPHLHEYGDPIEEELWLAFEKEMKGTDTSNWMYQGEKATDRPADLGYYMGYKIAEAYYARAADKKQAVRDILELKNADEFLKASGYAAKFSK